MKILNLHSEPLQKIWTDAYGHLNEAYYLVPFTNATWKMQTHFGLGVEYFKTTGCAVYTLETHLRYVAEVRPPAELFVQTLILGSDAKRIWFDHKLIAADKLRATAEFILLHYDTRNKCAAELPTDTQIKLKRAKIDSHPDWIGRRVSLTER